MSINFHRVKNRFFPEKATTGVRSLTCLRNGVGVLTCRLVIYFECVKTFSCETTIRISLLRKSWVVFGRKLLQLLDCQLLFATLVHQRSLVNSSRAVFFNSNRIARKLHLVKKWYKLIHSEEIMFPLKFLI